VPLPRGGGFSSNTGGVRVAERRLPRGLLDPESQAIAEAYEALPALRRQAGGLLSLDPQQDQSLGQTAFEVLASFIPGVGPALASRDIERARRAKDPAAAALAATEFVPFAKALKPFSKMDESAKKTQVKYTPKNDLVDVDLQAVSNRPNTLYLSKISVPPKERGSGMGTEAMQDMIDFADQNKKTITLSPSTDFGATSVSRLKDFYKRFGFVENKGRNKDFTIRESMYRLPKEVE
jgi:predicted GNAT family N-acyltransferase